MRDFLGSVARGARNDRLYRETPDWREWNRPDAANCAPNDVSLASIGPVDTRSSYRALAGWATPELFAPGGT